MFELFLIFIWNHLHCTAQTSDSIVLSVSIQEEYPVGKVITRLPEAIAQYDHRPFESTTRTHTQIHLLPTHDWSLFRVTPDGMLINSKRLDREKLCPSEKDTTTHLLAIADEHPLRVASTTSNCVLSIRGIVYENISFPDPTDAVQLKWKRRLRPLSVEITLLDINDNRPTCKLDFPPFTGTTSTAYNQMNVNSAELTENTPPGTLVAKWTLIDLDTKENGITGARLFGSRDGRPGMAANELPFQLQFEETGGPWNKIGLRLMLTQRLDLSTVDRSTRHRLVHEEIELYDLKVIVLDAPTGHLGTQGEAKPFSSYSSVCGIKVRVMDVNDHNPVWVSPSAFTQNQVVELKLFETKIYNNRELLRLLAQDDDLGANARISYHFLYELKNFSNVDMSYKVSELETNLIQRLFYLDPLTGSFQLRSSSIDFETLREWLASSRTAEQTLGKLSIQIRVIAVDNPANRSEQRISSPGLILVWLYDVNDCPPEIKIIGLHRPVGQPSKDGSSTDIVYVSENLPTREPIAFISATDPDSIPGSQVVCELGTEHTPDGIPGIHLSRAFQLVPFTRENQQTTAIDRSFSSSETITTNYKLITLISLDRELHSRYQLNITCSDLATSPIPTSSAELQAAQNPVRLTSYRLVDVLVTDLNDNAPKILGTRNAMQEGFGQPIDQNNDTFSCQVKEHSPVGTRICQVFANDPDFEIATGLEWWVDKATQHFVSIERESGWMKVDSNGVGVAEPVGRYDLDRETVTRISVLVFVRDYGFDVEQESIRLTTSATVTIYVIDINDQTPKIPEYNYFHISESVTSGTLIGTLTAIDEDQPGTPNSALSYHVASLKVQREILSRAKYTEDVEKLFGSNETANNMRDIMLDERTGELRVSVRGLDRERTTSYKFVVTVTDGEPAGGRPGLPLSERNHVHTVVHIMVDDENDNAPRIIYPEKHLATYTISCTNLRNLPYTIAQISVNDSDSGVNAEVLYLLSPVRNFGSKAPNRTTVMPMNTSDSNYPSRNKSTLLGSNGTTEALFFEELENSSTTSETKSNAHGSVTLLPFQIDPQNGLLTIISIPEDSVCTKAQDGRKEKDPYTQITEYRFKVIVSDRGIPSLSTSAVLVIRIVPSSSKISNFDEPRFAENDPQTSDYSIANKLEQTDSHYHQLAHLQDSVDSEPGSQSLANYWTVLNSPEVFWAAIICLTIATGVLIFLLVIVTLVSCGRRQKYPIDSTQPHHNEWADHTSPDDDDFSRLPNLVKRVPNELELNKTHFSPAQSSIKIRPNGLSHTQYNLYHLPANVHPVTCNPTVHAHTGTRQYSPLLTTASHSTSPDELEMRISSSLSQTYERQPRTDRTDPYYGYQKLIPVWHRDPLTTRCGTIQQDLFRVERAGSAEGAIVHENLNTLMQSSFHSVENIKQMNAEHQGKCEIHNGIKTKTNEAEQQRLSRVTDNQGSESLKRKSVLNHSPCSPKFNNSNEISFV